VSEERKATAVFDYFDSIMGTPPSHDCPIAFAQLDLPRLQSNQLYDRFTKEEVWAVIIKGFAT
jgi:hypothetical protein